MSYIYLQEQEEESSADRFSDIEQYVQLKLKNTQGKYCFNGKEARISHGSQYGTILKPLTEDHGKGKLTLFPGGSLVKTFQQQEKELESLGKDQDCGKKWPGWFAKYDQGSSSWKTPQCSLLGGLEPFSETWPKWGIMRDGACWELMTPELHTEEKESGFWATPLTMDSLPPKSEKALMKEATMARPGRNKPANLRDQVQPESMRMWPTPCTQDYRRREPNSKQQGLPEQIHKTIFPTPKTSGFCSGSGAAQMVNDLAEQGKIDEKTRRSMRAGNGGQLNPDWVEWLMGWPIGWSSLEPIEIPILISWDTDPADTGEIPRVATGIPNRVNRLKAIGNGQVPAVAAMAFSILSDGLI